MKQNRYTLFIGLTALLAGLSACQEQEKTDSEMNGSELVIRVLLDGEPIATEQTRTYSGDINLLKQGFTVVGYKTPDLFFNADPNFTPAPNIFNAGTTKEPIMEVAATNGKFTIPLIKEQEDGTYLSLFAWASAPGIDASGNAVSAITATAHKKTDTGAPWIDVTLPSPEAKSQPDIVGAHYMNQSNEYVVSAIDLDFKHLLSKITLRARNAIAADVVINKVEIVQQDICTTARFEFDGSDSLGVWKNHTNKSSATLLPEGWQQKQVTALNTATLGEALLIPQQAANEFWTLKVTYVTLLADGSQGGEVTRLVPLKALQLRQGKNYIYTLDLSAEEIKLQNVTVEPWKEYAYPGLSVLPMIEGEMDPDVLLLLDGSEPPYETADGRKFWLDRSGWNHHCQIMDKTQYSGSGAFDITYSASGKGYVINNNYYTSDYLYNYIKIPYLGNVEGSVTYEVVCSQSVSGQSGVRPFIITNSVIASSGKSGVLNALELAPNLAVDITTMAWNYGTTPGYSSYENKTINYQKAFDWSKRAFYYGTRDVAGSITVGVDDTHVLTTSRSSSYDVSKPFNGGYIGPKFKGTINYLKIMKKALSTEEVKNDYNEAKKKFNIPTFTAPKVSAVTSGLIACWDGRSGLSSGSSNGNGKIWTDEIAHYPLTTVIPSGNSTVIKAANNAINFAGPMYTNVGGYMEGSNSLGGYSSATFEAVYKSTSNATYNYLLEFKDVYDRDKVAALRPNTGNNKGIELVVVHYVANCYSEIGDYAFNRKNHIVGVIDYSNKKLLVYYGGVLYNSVNFSTSNTYLPLDKLIVGNNAGIIYPYQQMFTGDIYAIRIYNRALSTSEIKANYEKDKTTYGLP